MHSKKTYTVNEAKLALEKYCIYQDRCHLEVINKLQKMQMIQEAQEQIIIHLIQHNFLNEERFAKSFARGKFYQKQWGKIKITNHLRAKNISSTNIQTGLKEIDNNDYQKTLHQLAIKKLPQVKGNNTFEKRIKLSAFLQSKGYEINIIINELDTVFKNY